MKLFDHICRKLNLSPTKKVIVENVAWSLVGKVVTLLGGLFVGILIARHLGVAQYGTMNYVISFVALFQIISTFGLDNIEVREEAKADVDPNVIMGTAFVIRIIFAVLTVLATITTAIVFHSGTYDVIYIAIYSLSIVARTFDVIRNRFTSLVKNEYVVKSEISRTLIGICIKLIILYLDAHLIWFVAASAFDFFLLGGGYLFAYKKVIGSLRKWKYKRAYAKYLIKEAFPLLLTSAAVFIYQRIDQVMIGDMVDKEAVGYFSTAARFVEILMFVPQIIAHTVSPILVETRKKSIEEYRIKAQSFMNVVVWGTMLMSLLTCLLAYWIVAWTYGQKFLMAVPILQVLAFKAASFALNTTAGHMIVIEGAQKYAIIRDLFGCVVCITLNYILLPVYGAIAASYIAILSYLCAGYIGDAIVPAYRHIFKMQTVTLLKGWMDLFNVKKLFAKS